MIQLTITTFEPDMVNQEIFDTPLTTGRLKKEVAMIQLMKGTKVIVCGSRNFTNYKYLERMLDKYALDLKPQPLIIVHGAARGADQLADDWCFARKRHRVVIIRYHADWKKHGKAAGHIRNVEMSHCGAKRLIAFWDGKSKGTEDMIKIAKRRGIKVKIFKVK